ncbi:Macrolide export ATP-binding/permease protein MacB (plasmid) [Apilactobacillus kunkeei]|nr:Macrolide export ATP-binding/permease protein MacB [Apilactobacillus kunkeei]CAI2670081.1 Macrolide export ATP-binding/permease protein MacB [Apilactobacillus kunkeei]CAI2671847.1 Macrolide export ATP-binding/permease protein MacB [Apilactobacillus kunkeei]CAI2672502.1 Macrolide export ATP-binding/permease protein MacB [Apilactobacillus kunkeei]CAI2673061.1 Macrolide export ATP-binding/permease protein MacB [Apilactobacillus kunkeei]
MSNDIAIKIKNLNKSFKDNQIFKNFYLDIPKNKITTIFGSSGSGKSTLLNMIGLLEKYDSGTIQILGVPIPKINSDKAMKLRRNTISYLFQNFGLIESNTIYDNLSIALEYEKLSHKDKILKMEKALIEVSLRKPLNTKVYNLSGGEKQRLAIAMVSIKPSEIILADEPTGSLDPRNRDYVMQKLIELNKKGKTIVIVSHDLKFKEISDKCFEIKV